VLDVVRCVSRFHLAVSVVGKMRCDNAAYRAAGCGDLHVCCVTGIRKWKVRTSKGRSANIKIEASTSTACWPSCSNNSNEPCTYGVHLPLTAYVPSPRHPAQRIAMQTSAPTFSLALLFASSINAPSANPADKLFGKRAKGTVYRGICD
jgi:hypothetical protein